MCLNGIRRNFNKNFESALCSVCFYSTNNGVFFHIIVVFFLLFGVDGKHVVYASADESATVLQTAVSVRGAGEVVSNYWGGRRVAGAAK